MKNQEIYRKLLWHLADYHWSHIKMNGQTILGYPLIPGWRRAEVFYYYKEYVGR